LIALDLKPGGDDRAAIVVVKEADVNHGVVLEGGIRHRVYAARVVRGSSGWLLVEWQALDS
jgi:hypothetical protein